MTVSLLSICLHSYFLGTRNEDHHPSDNKKDESNKKENYDKNNEQQGLEQHKEKT